MSGLVGVLEEQACDRLDLIDEMAVEPDTVDDRQVVRLAQRKIVDAVSRRRVHDTGAILGADEVGREHGKRFLRIDRR